MKVSSRIKKFNFSPIRKVTPYSDAAEKKGIKVYRLNIGQPDIKSPTESYDFLRSLKPGTVAYGPSEGTSELRSAFAGYYNKLGLQNIGPEDILVTTGASEAIFFVFLALCEPGSQIIVVEPFYTNYTTMAQAAGAEIVPVTSRIEDNFKLPSITEFEKAVTPKTRVILLNNPANPTGCVCKPEGIEALLELCKKHDLALVADEVYREFCYGGLKAKSVLSYEEYQERTVCIDSVSKRFSLCGARIGAIVSKNHEMLQECLKIAQARLSPPVLGEVAAMGAFSSPKSYIDNVVQTYQERRDCLVGELEKIPGVRFGRPDGAFYLIAELPVEDAEDFCIFMLRDFSFEGQTVALAPAAGFYINSALGKSQVRIAYVLDKEDLKKAALCLKKGLEAYLSR